MTKEGMRKLTSFVACMLLAIVAFSMMSTAANAVAAGGPPSAQGVQKKWVYADGQEIPEEDLKTLMEQGVIPSSVDIFYILTSSDDSQWGYAAADGELHCELLGIPTDGMKPLNEIGLQDIGGWSKQILSSTNGWNINFGDDIESVFGSYITQYNLYLNPAVKYTFIPYKEFIPEGYPMVSFTGTATDLETGMVTFTNTFNGEKPHTSINVVKTWKGYDNAQMPSSIKVSLLNAEGTVVSTIELTAANGWKGAFTGLPTYANGQLIDYSAWSVREDTAVANNTVTYAGNAQQGFEITNTVNPPKEEKTTTRKKVVKRALPPTGDASSVAAAMPMVVAGISLAAAGLISRKR